MKRRPAVSVFAQSLFILLLAWSVNPSASAAQVTLNFTGLVAAVNGDLTGYFNVGDINPTVSQFSFSTDEAAATVADTTATTGYDSRYQFSGGQNGISLTYAFISPYNPPSPMTYTFDSLGNIEVRVSNDRVIDQAGSTALAGLVSPGTYDRVDLLWTIGGWASGAGAGDLETWQLSIFGDAGWFANGGLVPDALPANYGLVVYASHDYTDVNSGALQGHLGDMLAGPAVSAVPVPPAVWLLASGLAGLGLTARRRNPAQASSPR